METVKIHDFARQAADLQSGQELRFQVPYEDCEAMIYFITVISYADSDCLYANCVGGGDPFVFDLSTYDTALRELTTALDEYVNGKGGKIHKFGSVCITDKLECKRNASSPL